MNYQILKNYRESRNITQKIMAKKLGIAHSGYVCVENGYKEPSLAVIKRISELTGYSLESLIYNSDEKEKESPIDELLAYKAVSFNLVKTLCVAPEAKRLGRSEIDIDDIALKKLNKMISALNVKTKKEYETAVNMRKKGFGING